MVFSLNLAFTCLGLSCHADSTEMDCWSDTNHVKPNQGVHWIVTSVGERECSGYILFSKWVKSSKFDQQSYGTSLKWMLIIWAEKMNDCHALWKFSVLEANMRAETMKVKADELEQYQNVSCWTPVLLLLWIVELVCLKKI